MKMCLLGLLLSFNAIAGGMIDSSEVIVCSGLSNHERGIESEYIMRARLEYDREENLIANIMDGYDSINNMECSQTSRDIVKCSGGQWYRGEEASIIFEVRGIAGQKVYAADVSNRSGISGGKRVVLPFCRKISL